MPLDTGDLLAKVYGAAAAAAKTRTSGNSRNLLEVADILSNRFVNGTGGTIAGDLGGLLGSKIGGQLGSVVGSTLAGLLGQSGTPGGSIQARNPLAAAKGRPDPLYDVDWYVDLPLLEGTTELPWEYVEEASLPLVEFGKISNYKAGKTYHYASQQNIGSLQLKLYEDVKGTTSTYFKVWQSLILDTDTGLYAPA